MYCKHQKQQSQQQQQQQQCNDNNPWFKPPRTLFYVGVKYKTEVETKKRNAESINDRKKE